MKTFGAGDVPRARRASASGHRRERPPRAAFVVTLSALSLLGCEKAPLGSGGAGGACEPPDCHMNPPPPTSELRPPGTPSLAASTASDAGVPARSKP